MKKEFKNLLDDLAANKIELGYGEGFLWIDRETGYFCEISRVRLLGHLCGYVQLPIDHPDFKEGYQEIYRDIEVHGSLTFSYGGKFGFDCAHSGDICPGSEIGAFDHFSTYKDFSFVKSEVESLAKQFKERETLLAEKEK